MRDFALSAYDAGVLVAERETRGLFRGSVGQRAQTPRPPPIWVINELFGRLNKEGEEIADSPVSRRAAGAACST